MTTIYWNSAQETKLRAQNVKWILINNLDPKYKLHKTACGTLYFVNSRPANRLCCAKNINLGIS